MQYNIKMKKSLCIRNTSSWSDLKPIHKFDSGKFDKKVILSNLYYLSPKMQSLIHKIQELDKKDLQENGTYYKHVIYSDVAGSYGAKMVASVLLANDDFNLVFGRNMKFDTNKKFNNNFSFGLLTTSTVFQKPMPAKLKKDILNNFNQRPENTYGNNMRFIIIDSGFKEGIDLFDVKYMHILEPLTTKAEHTQVLGRCTRYCGQSGLPFEKGWKLHVYRYNLMYDQEKTVHDLYLQYCDKNISALNFVADIDDLFISCAVDTPLTLDIHNLMDNKFYEEIIDYKKRESNAVEKTKKHIALNNIKGKIYSNNKSIVCDKNRCDEIPDVILLLSAIFMSNNEFLKILKDQSPREKYCKMLNNQSYCNIIQMLTNNEVSIFKIYGKDFWKQYNDLKRSKTIHPDNVKMIEEYALKYQHISNKPIVRKNVPPTTKMDYMDLYKYVSTNYSNYKWIKTSVKNGCKETGDMSNKDSNIVQYTNTQNFIRDFLTPLSPYKGIFLYHSVGSGKTCTAIATATSTFDKENYTILWVTRHTLKNDIWKNMFDKVCNVIIRDKIQKGMKIPRDMKERMKLLGKNWLMPISYKQFTNMIRGKNKLYEEMVKRNGKNDPFKKTFIIIDEVHKIFSNSLPPLERPDQNILQKMAHESFEKSGKNSLKLMLMSATPITEDPMSFIKIMNLILEKKDAFPTDFETFKKEYCQNDGKITDESATVILNKVAGLISYIDRKKDISYFAQPEINDVIVHTQPIENNDMIKLEKNKLILADLEMNMKQEKDKKTLEILKKKYMVTKRSIKNMEKSFKSNNTIDYINQCL